MLIIAESRIFNQWTLAQIHAHDPPVQRYQIFFDQRSGVRWQAVSQTQWYQSARQGQKTDVGNSHPSMAIYSLILQKEQSYLMAVT